MVGDPRPDAEGGFQDIEFDTYGRVYIVNPALARKFQDYYDQYGHRMKIVRDPFPGEPRPSGDDPASRRPFAITNIAATADQNLASLEKPAPVPPFPDDEADPKINLMCPCSPEP